MVRKAVNVADEIALSSQISQMESYSWSFVRMLGFGINVFRSQLT